MESNTSNMASTNMNDNFDEIADQTVWQPSRNEVSIEPANLEATINSADRNVLSNQIDDQTVPVWQPNASNLSEHSSEPSVPSMSSLSSATETQTFERPTDLVLVFHEFAIAKLRTLDKDVLVDFLEMLPVRAFGNNYRSFVSLKDQLKSDQINDDCFIHSLLFLSKDNPDFLNDIFQYFRQYLKYLKKNNHFNWRAATLTVLKSNQNDDDLDPVEFHRNSHYSRHMRVVLRDLGILHDTIKSSLANEPAIYWQFLVIVCAFQRDYDIIFRRAYESLKRLTENDTLLASALSSLFKTFPVVMNPNMPNERRLILKSASFLHYLAPIIKDEPELFPDLPEKVQPPVTETSSSPTASSTQNEPDLPGESSETCECLACLTKNFQIASMERKMIEMQKEIDQYTAKQEQYSLKRKTAKPYTEKPTAGTSSQSDNAE